MDRVHLLGEVPLDIMDYRAPAFCVDLAPCPLELSIEVGIAREVALSIDVEAPKAGRRSLGVVLFCQLGHGLVSGGRALFVLPALELALRVAELGDELEIV